MRPQAVAPVFITQGNLKVGLEYIGEGFWGDYDSENEDDEPLLRLRVDEWRGQGYWEEIEWTSWCTGISARLPRAEVVRAIFHLLEIITPVYRSGGSLEALCAGFSGVTEIDLADRLGDHPPEGRS